MSSRLNGVRWVCVVVAVAAAGACSGGGTGAGQPASERYSSEVDGLAVSYPPTWHRAETPLAAAPVGSDVEVLGLATGELPDSEHSVDFLANERGYTAFLAYRGDLTDERRAELDAVWSSLTLRPIPTADETAAVIGERYWHVLYTHCGILETHFADRDWVADPALHDASRNPPAGWGNPHEAGVMTLTSHDRAHFESRDGQRDAGFRPRTSSDPPAEPCEQPRATGNLAPGFVVRGAVMRGAVSAAVVMVVGLIGGGCVSGDEEEAEPRPAGADVRDAGMGEVGTCRGEVARQEAAGS